MIDAEKNALLRLISRCDQAASRSSRKPTDSAHNALNDQRACKRAMLDSVVYCFNGTIGLEQ